MSTTVIITGTSRGLGAALFTAYLQRDARVCALSCGFTQDQQRAARRAPEPGGPAPRRSGRHCAPARPGRECRHDRVRPLGVVGAAGAQRGGGNAARARCPRPARDQHCRAGQRAGGDAVDQRVRGRLAVPCGRPAGGVPDHDGDQQPVSRWATYCATKAAADLYIRCAADGGGDPRTTVQVLEPGGMDTAMHAQLRRHGAGLPGHERLLRRHASCDLAEVATVARRVVAQTLRPVGNRPATTRTADHL